MTWFPFVIVVTNNQNKGIEPTWSHLKVESGSDYGSFSKGRKNMAFHSFLDHVSDYFIFKMTCVCKHNLTTLPKDQPP